MSQESATSRENARHRTTVSKALSSCGERIVSCVRAVGFWLAVVSPIALVGALLAGLGGERPLLFVTLVAASVLCTLVGHEHVPG